MDDQPTCGKGLAHHSALPAKLGALMAATAEVLEVHMRALDLSDERSQREHEVYAELARAHRRIADDLAATAARMASSRDLPMGAHDMQAMMSDPPRVAFARLVQEEENLSFTLQARLEEDRTMLAQMSGEGRAGPEQRTR